MQTLSDWAHWAGALQGVAVATLLIFLLVKTSRRLRVNNYTHPELLTADKEKWWLAAMMLLAWAGSGMDTGWWAFARVVGANQGDPHWTWMFDHWFPVIGLVLGVVAGVGHFRTLWPFRFNRYAATSLWVVGSCLLVGLALISR